MLAHVVDGGLSSEQERDLIEHVERVGDLSDELVPVLVARRDLVAGNGRACLSELFLRLHKLQVFAVVLGDVLQRLCVNHRFAPFFRP